MPATPHETGHPIPRPLRVRNRTFLALEARFAARAEGLVNTIINRALGGDPAAMRLCLERALPVGRGRPPPIQLPPVESPDDARRAMAEVTAALGAGTITIREAVQLLDAVASHLGHIPAIETVRKAARIEADLAKAAGAIGIDHVFTISEGPQAARAAAVAAAANTEPSASPDDARSTS